MGRRRLIPWSRLVRVNLENQVSRWVYDSLIRCNHRIAGTVSIGL